HHRRSGSVADSTTVDRVDRGFHHLAAVRHPRRQEGERAAVEARHSAFFACALQRIDATDPDALYGSRRHEIISALRLEYSDLEAVLARALARAETDTAVAISDALWALWLMRGPYTAALERLERMLGLPLTDTQRATALLRSGRLRISLGQMDQAEQLLEVSAALARELHDAVLEQELHLMFLRLYVGQGRHDEMLARAKLALDLAQRCGSWSLECRTMMQLSRHLADLDASYAWLLKAEQIALGHDAFGLLTNIVRNLGDVDTKRGRLDSAKRHFLRAQVLGSGSDDLAAQMSLAFEQAYLFRRSGRIAESLAFSEACVRDCRRLGDRVTEIQVLIGMGWSLSLLGRLDEAYATYLRALNAARAVNNRTNICVLLNALGGLSAVRTDREHPLQESQTWFREALQVAIELGEPHREAMSRMNLGKLCCLRGEYAEGMALLRGALDTYERNGDPRRAGSVLVTMSAALFDEGSLIEAEEHLCRADDIAREHEDRPLSHAVHPLWVRIKARLGQLEAAEARLAEIEPTDDNTQEAEVWLARAELAHARAEFASRLHALSEASQRVHPDTLGRRFRELASLEGSLG
ncbi:MAG: hypothetical protein ABMA64_25970, partial [Myxococcota bacterium]